MSTHMCASILLWAHTFLSLFLFYMHTHALKTYTLNEALFIVRSKPNISWIMSSLWT